MSLLELAAYTHTNLQPVKSDLKLLWSEVYQAIKTNNIGLASQRLQSLIHQKLEDQKLAIALEILFKKLQFLFLISIEYNRFT